MMTGPRFSGVRTALALGLILVFLGGCDFKQNDQPTITPGMDMQPLTTAQYIALPPMKKYQVANRLLGALYKGAPFRDFFDTSGGLNNLRARGDYARLPAWTEEALRTPVTDEQTNLGLANGYYFRSQEQEQPLALLYTTPLSKTQFDWWMAYFLANTFQYSPSLELSTVEGSDLAQVVGTLYQDIKSDRPIREIVYDYMISEQNWRRFRSPEDNTREMMEQFLGRLIDAEVPPASKACQNWSLSRSHTLVISAEVNTQPQRLLGRTIVSCEDFYRAVAEHEDLIPATSAMLVDYFFGSLPAAQRGSLSRSLAATNPETYREMFRTVLFSQAYLLYAERPQGFEQLFFNAAHRMYWQPGQYFFYSLRSRLDQMNQPVFQYKLGRYKTTPMDTLSLAWSHSTLRDWGLLDRRHNTSNQFEQGWSEDFIDVQFQGRDYLRYLFLAMLGREPMETETLALEEVLANAEYKLEKLEHRMSVTRVVLDYFSRLPEFYYLNPIQ